MTVSEKITGKKQYDLMNAMKLIAAFFVVTIHVHFPGSFGQSVIAVARFAVPFFFMVSGFFCCYENPAVVPSKMKRKIKHILFLMLGAMLLYILFYSAKAIHGGTFGSYVSGLVSPRSILAFIGLNQTYAAEFLWFLPALLYAYGIFFGFEKLGITKKTAILVPLLSVSGVLFRELKEILPNAPEILDRAYLYRNFLFVGLPFLLMGYFIRVHQEKLTEKLSDASLILMMLIGFGESIAVDLLHTQKSVYLGTILAVFALFVLIVKKEDNVHVPHLASLGADYSLYIYIFHILVKNVLRGLGDVIPVIGKGINVLEPAWPIVIFLMTLAVSAVYVELKNTVKKAFSKKRETP